MYLYHAELAERPKDIWKGMLLLERCDLWRALLAHCFTVGLEEWSAVVVSFEICLLSMWILHYSTLLVPFSIASKYRLENDTYLGT